MIIAFTFGSVGGAAIAGMETLISFAQSWATYASISRSSWFSSALAYNI